jgi:hypothetical protein
LPTTGVKWKEIFWGGGMKKIVDTSKPARRIEVTGKTQRRISHEEVAAALGAEILPEGTNPFTVLQQRRTKEEPPKTTEETT